MGDITRGTTFVAGQENVDHNDLHALVDDAVIKTSLVTGKGVCSDPHATDDRALIYDSSAAALKQVTATAWAEAGLTTSAVTGKTENTDPQRTGDMLLLFDTSASALRKVTPGRLADLAVNSRPGCNGVLLLCDGAHTVEAGAGAARLSRACFVNAAGQTFGMDQIGFYTPTLDLSSAGANGVGAGTTLAANTWYHLWFIYNPTTATVAGVLSAEDEYWEFLASDDLPEGYTHACYAGAVYCTNQLTPVFTAFVQADAYVAIPPAALVNKAITTIPTFLSGPEIALLAAAVPANARAVQLNITSDGGAVYVAPKAATTGRILCSNNTTARLALDEFKFAIWAGAGTPTMTVEVVGYELPI